MFKRDRRQMGCQKRKKISQKATVKSRENDILNCYNPNGDGEKWMKLRS